MPRNVDKLRFRNEDLILGVEPDVDRKQWDETLYEKFLDELCDDREYQKNAIRTTLRYFLGGEYDNLRDLARRNYQKNPILQDRYGTWKNFEDHLQFPDHLSASLDLATGTGKSYVLYGVAHILLAIGAVDRVIVLCPSTTIEAGLLEKFKELAGNPDLQASLPSTARVLSPRVTRADVSIVSGSICVENYHAVLEHVDSSIRASLEDKDIRVAVLNDEAHHVANEPTAKAKKWKEFLTDPNYNFIYILGVSGTCYIGDDYFADVIYRYSLRQAIEENRVKKVNYVAEMPETNDPDEKWQIVYRMHEETKRRLKKRNILPLTIAVTPNIERCKGLAEEIKYFLVERDGISLETANERVLVVYNNSPGVLKLPSVDKTSSKVEWIVSVSMLNEGWDVKRVFQIVPDEERAFNSKLLIAQVLGRGLRIPGNWGNGTPEVVVFNHDKWVNRIRHLVNEILEFEKRLSSQVLAESPYHFTLLQINHQLDTTTVVKPVTDTSPLFGKGYLNLATDVPVEDVRVDFERALSGEQYRWQASIVHKTYTPHELALLMYRRLEEEQDLENPDEEDYTDQFPVERLEEIIIKSLRQSAMTVATEAVKQKFLAALGRLHNKPSESIRYVPVAERYYEISTRQRQSNSVSASELKAEKCFFYTHGTRDTLQDEQVEFFDEVTEPGSAFRNIEVPNRHDFKTPLNAVIADSGPERRFIRDLVDAQNTPYYEVWIKSTNSRFYEIDYQWQKGEYTKPSKFSPDFFIKKSDDLVLVVEIKADEEKDEVTEENAKKYEYAIGHFQSINDYLEQIGSPLRYKFNFLTPCNFPTYFQTLRDGNILGYKSELDEKLLESL